MTSVNLSLIAEYLSEFIESLAAIVPRMLYALGVLLVGYVVGRIVGESVRIFLTRVLNLERWLEHKKLDKALYNIKASQLISGMAKWYIYFLFLGVAVTVSEIPVLTEFMSSFLAYLPRIYGAILVIVLGFFAGEWLKNEIVKSDFPLKKEAGGIAKFFVLFVFAVSGLETAGFSMTVLVDIIRILAIGVVLTIVVAVGLGVGLALKDEIKPYVREFLQRMFVESELEKKGEAGEEE